MKILCFAPRPSQTYPLSEPWAVLHASRLLAASGYRVSVVQSGPERNFIDDIKRESSAAVLGISCITSYAIIESMAAAKAYMEANPSGTVVWGGWHPSIFPEQVIESGLAHCCVIGQGERTFFEVCEAVREKRSLHGIPGTVVPGPDGKPQHSMPRKFEDVNNFPPVPYDAVDLTKNIRGSNLGKRTIRYHSSQGCPHRCGFCVDPVVYPHKWSGLKAERVVEDWLRLKADHGIDSVILTDSNFFTDAKRALRVAKLLIESKADLTWGNANGRTHQLLKYSPDEWDLLRESGLREVLVGAESALQEGLDLIQKDCTVEETVALAKVCTRHKISVRFSMMVGLPYDLPKDKLGAMSERELDGVLKMMDAIYKLNSTHNRALCFVFTPYPGTPMYQLSLKLGMPEPKKLQDWARFELNEQNTTWVPPEVTRKVAMLTEYIWPWLEEEYIGVVRAMSWKAKLVMLPAALMVRIICRFRWALKWFGMPIDYRIFMALMRAKS